MIACGNVAILLLARTVNRSSEFALRTALGAGRSRIVAQLFVETLVLALLATGVGLLGFHLIVERVTPGIDLPFWVDPGVTPEVVMEALALGVASAVFAGVLPALRATGSSPQRTLQEAGGGLGGFRFGRVTGALIIAEVGLGVGALFATGMTYRMFSAIDQETSVAMQWLPAGSWWVVACPSGCVAVAPASQEALIAEAAVALGHPLHRDAQVMHQGHPGSASA